MRKETSWKFHTMNETRGKIGVMNVCYNLRRNGKLIGNMYCEGVKFKDTLDRVYSMINSYNRLLSRSVLEYDLFAVRFFEKESDNGKSNTSIKPEIYKTAREFIEDVAPMFYMTPISQCNDRMGLIGITEGTMRINLNDNPYIITIDLDNCTISFGECLREYDIGNFTFNELEKYKNCTYNFDKLPFNELEDAREFVKENQCGWIPKYNLEVVVIPVAI